MDYKEAYLNYEKKVNETFGKKGKDKWYPVFAPHIILGTDKSILDYMDYEQAYKDYMIKIEKHFN